MGPNPDVSQELQSQSFLGTQAAKEEAPGSKTSCHTRCGTFYHGSKTPWWVGASDALQDDWVSQRGERCLAVLCAMQEAQEAPRASVISRRRRKLMELDD